MRVRSPRHEDQCTPLPGAAEDVANQTRATVETLRIRLRFQFRRSRFLQNGISQHKGWKNNLLKLSLKAAKMTSYYGPHRTLSPISLCVPTPVNSGPLGLKKFQPSRL